MRRGVARLVALGVALGALGALGATGVACSGRGHGQRTRVEQDAADAAGRDGGAVTSRALGLDEARALLWPPQAELAQARFRPATEVERARLAALIAALWRGVEPGAVPPELPRWADEAGFALELWTIEARAVWVVREPDGKRRGGGAYLVRAGAPAPGTPVLLQAPHVYFDVGTGAIAARMFLDADAPVAVRALFTNSLHRHAQHDAARERRDANPADVARAPDHAFHAATTAVVEAGPVVIVQVHGYDHAVRDDDAAARAAAIVSAGRADGSTAISTAVAAAIAAELGREVARYPEDTRELGGVTGAQARLARDRGAAFVHVELAADVRDRLRRDGQAAAALGRAVAGAIAGAAEPAP